MEDYSPEQYSSFLNKATGDYNHSFTEEYSKDTHESISEVEEERQEYRVFNQLNNKISFF